MSIYLDKKEDYARLEYDLNEKYLDLGSVIDEDYIDRVFPSDKSITHRALFLSSLIEKGGTILNPLVSLDTIATMKCLNKLGVEFDFILDGKLFKDLAIDNYIIDEVLKYRSIRIDIKHSNKTNDTEIKRIDLDCGGSGTCARLIMGMVCSLGKRARSYYIDGNPSLRVRPMRRVVDILVKMGVSIEKKDNLPIFIQGIESNGIKLVNHKFNIASAQLKSMVILGYLNSIGSYRIELPSGSRKHTEDMIEDLFLKNKAGSIHTSYKDDKESNIKVECIEVKQTKAISSFDREEFDVSKDPSSIIFFIILFSLLGKKVSFKNVSNSYGRLDYINILNDIGFNIKINSKDKYSVDIVSMVENNGRTLEDRLNALSSIRIEKDRVASMIDELPCLMVLSGFIEGKSYFYRIQELRVKESDRLDGVIRFLKEFGVDVDVKESIEGVDVVIYGKGYKKIEHNKKEDFIYYDSCSDHRMAMIATIFSMVLKKNMVIKNVECVKESFPSFWKIIERLF